MPTYEYRCDACGHEFEKEQRITEKPIKKCPKCGAMKSRRMVGGTGFILKGGGWYSDLYSGPSNAKSGGTGGDTSTATETKAETKSESKTETKSESKPKAEKKKAKAKD